MESEVPEQLGTLHLTHRQLSGAELDLNHYQVVTSAYCPHGHSLIDEQTTFFGFNGITIALRSPRQTGRLSLSPVIGDLSRIFYNFHRMPGEIVEIGCPTCDVPLPVYDQCPCGAYLVALFSLPHREFSDCIGVCQRIGCLHAKLISTYSLRKFSRLGYY